MKWQWKVQIPRLDPAVNWLRCTYPSLGPSGVGGAHGELWLLRSERGWQVGSLLSNILSFCLFYRSLSNLCDTFTLKKTLSQHQHICTRFVLFSEPVASQTSGEGRKSFWQLRSRNDRLPHLVRVSVVTLPWSPFPSAPPWTALTCVSSLSPVWGVWFVLDWVDRSSSLRFAPTEPGHDDNLEAAEQLSRSALCPPPVVPVHGKCKCWRRGFQCAGR